MAENLAKLRGATFFSVFHASNSYLKDLAIATPLTSNIRLFVRYNYKKLINSYQNKINYNQHNKYKKFFLFILKGVLHFLTQFGNLKTVSSRLIRKEYPWLAPKYFYNKPYFWTGSYLVASCGGATVEQLKKYVEQQATSE